jgi:hypothetical protein
LYPYKIGVAFSKPNKAKLHRILTDGGCYGLEQKSEYEST